MARYEYSDNYTRLKLSTLGQIYYLESVLDPVDFTSKQMNI